MKLQSHIPYLVTIAAFCLIARADVPPNSFSAGSTISAAQMNQNFVAAFSAITELKAHQVLKVIVVKNTDTNGTPYVESVAVPPNATQLMVDVIGGGGSGSCDSATAMSGQSGTHLKTYITLSDLSIHETDLLTVTVGGGGPARAAGSTGPGNSGTSSKVAFGGTLLVEALGGRGGQATVAPLAPPTLAGPTSIIATSSIDELPYTAGVPAIAGLGSPKSNWTGATCSPIPSRGSNGMVILTFR